MGLFAFNRARELAKKKTENKKAGEVKSPDASRTKTKTKSKKED
jgi:hypothetical protein